MSYKKTLTWLHISDAHLCEPRAGWDAKDIIDKLHADFQRMAEEHNLGYQL